MSRKSQSKSTRLTRRTFAAGVGAAGFVTGTAPFNILRAQGGALKVGVLLPRSGSRPASARIASAAPISRRRS